MNRYFHGRGLKGTKTLIRALLITFVFSNLIYSAHLKSDEVSSAFIAKLNALTYQIAYEHDQFYSLIGIRALTMVHLAIHDALNSINSRYSHYAYHAKRPNAHAKAAISQAAYEILIHQYPNRKDTLDQVIANILGNIAASSAKKDGILLGHDIAKHYIKLRDGDGHEKQGDYTPMSKPGDYQYTPGWDNWVLKPDFDYAMPFALDTVTQFRSPEPPGLKSEAYTASFDEVKRLGGKNSRHRTTDQTNYAHWWAEFAEHSWNRIGRIAALKGNLSAWETARMFALINMDIYDIYLSSLESKYFYDTWRPLTAIQEANDDGNPATISQADWEPEMLTPPWPEYPSAHASVGAGGAEIMSHVLGTSKLSFSMESTTGLSTARTRAFEDLREAAEECAESRIMNGYHFRFATEEGIRQGEKIARYICRNFLRPVDSGKASHTAD
jgi:hypothetical protein